MKIKMYREKNSVETATDRNNPNLGNNYMKLCIKFEAFQTQKCLFIKMINMNHTLASPKHKGYNVVTRLPRVPSYHNAIARGC